MLCVDQVPTSVPEHYLYPILRQSPEPSLLFLQIFTFRDEMGICPSDASGFRFYGNMIWKRERLLKARQHAPRVTPGAPSWEQRTRVWTPRAAAPSRRPGSGDG